MSLVLGLLLGSGMVLAQSAAPSASARQTLERVTLAHGLCEQSHPESAIRLPDDWAQHDISAPDIACYRAHLQLDRLPDHTWALRIDRLPGNHHIVLNGFELSNRHMERPTATSLATLPYLIEFPVHALRKGDNLSEASVRMNPFRKPGISPLSVGPMADMRADFDQWVLFTVDLPKILNLSVAGVALFLLLAWRARPSDRIFLYFAGLMLVMCSRNAFYFLETI